MQTTRALPYVLGLSALLILGACTSLDAPNQNASTVNVLEGGTPSRSEWATAAQGLIAGMRGDVGDIVQTFGMLGREGWVLDPGNPQTVKQFFNAPMGDVGPWANPYSVIKMANLVLVALERVAELTDQEREGARGFVKTVIAIELLTVISSMDDAGAALDVTQRVTDAPPPIVDKSQVFSRIIQLLDEAKTHLQAGGSSFLVDLGTGFAGFNTPATFLTFNRAIKARAEIQQSHFAAALVALAESFLDATGPLSLGVYHVYSTASGDAVNFLNRQQALHFAHTRLATGAQLQPNGSRDARFLAKVEPIAPFNRQGFSVEWHFKMYLTPSTPVGFIRNEELMLLRAEANLGLGNVDAALPDINLVRQQSGGLAPIALATWQAMSPDQRVSELLYNKTYSLLWETGTTWLDARRYSRLANLPKDRPGDLVFPHTRLPLLECDPRSPQPPGCTPPAGL